MRNYNPNVSVGWYGRPTGRSADTTMVHIHRSGHGPVCGARIHPDAEYQWCSWDNLTYVECESCKRSKVARLMYAKERTQNELNIILNS
jgi:hypothetical protein